MGYGFKLEVKEALDALPEYDSRLDDLDATVEREYPLLTMEFGGSMYGDNEGFEQWIFIKSTVAKVRDWATDLDPQELLNGITDEAMTELFDFCESTGTAVGKPQWRMMITQC